jgi:hypothetical protein
VENPTVNTDQVLMKADEGVGVVPEAERQDGKQWEEIGT